MISRTPPRPALAACALAIALLPACGGGRQKAYRAAGPAGGDAAYAESGAPAGAAPGQGAYRGAPSRPAPRERPGLGTSFGEEISSRVTETRFERASEDPFAQVAIFYNDLEGVRAQARYRGAELHDARAYTPHGGISISLTDPYGRVLPGLSGGGRTYVVGHDGERYNLVVRNDTGGRFEVVASVDGLDVVDGRSAGFHKRGYVLGPYSTLVIDGFRTSASSVAAFRFGSVSDSYAARTGKGRNVGVVGLAFFAERHSPWTTDELHRRETADPFPSRYARPPR